jgi:Xaa-Pro aminopeptidase
MPLLRYFMTHRMEKARRFLKRLAIDALLVSNPSNIFYLSGFHGHDSLLVLGDAFSYIITDFRYKEEAERDAKGFVVISDRDNLYNKCARIVKKNRIRSLGFEAHYMTVQAGDILRDLIGFKPLPTVNLIEGLRIKKDSAEIKKIRQSAIIAKKVVGLLEKSIKPGASEKDIANQIDFCIKRLGAERPSFDTIVLSGKNTSMPHGKPSNRLIEKGDPVLMDFGARLDCYSSDLTRMVFVGKITNYINIIYSIVRSAQKKAIEKIRPGVKASEIDKAARSYIRSKGFEKYFGHATGHGIGIDVHELPQIGSKNHVKLKQGMVFSVEPGIYIPGEFGIRIEDMVLVTSSGCEVITR